jgi:hypothetical protein
LTFKTVSTNDNYYALMKFFRRESTSLVPTIKDGAQTNPAHPTLPLHLPVEQTFCQRRQRDRILILLGENIR